LGGLKRVFFFVLLVWFVVVDKEVVCVEEVREKNGVKLKLFTDLH